MKHLLVIKKFTQRKVWLKTVFFQDALMQDIGGAPAPANPAAVYSELGGAAGPVDVLPNVSGTVAVDDNDDVSYVLSSCFIS